METVVVYIDQASAVRSGDPRLTNAPLPGHDPVQDRRAGWHLVNGHGRHALESGQRAADAVARDAAQDGVELSAQGMQRCSRRGRRLADHAV
jgi:hypothetical protein